ncbi:MAG: hypothetical protein ABII12_07705 [Planctomycetota bacterium]
MIVSATILFTTMLAMPVGINDDDLESSLREHFLARTSSQRTQIQKKILADRELTPAKLAAAIRALQLWSAQPSGEQQTVLRLRRGESSERPVWIHVPQGYDPAKRWPLVITLHGHGGQAVHMLRLTRQLLGNRAEEFIIAAPQDIGPLGFTLPTHTVQRPRDLLNALRRVYHIDSDRVYLMGYSQGSHNTWLAAIMHADCFAGIVPLATHLQVVGDDLLYASLLPDTRSLGILFCWGKLDTLDAEGKPHPQGGNAHNCRRMRTVIEGLKFEHFHGIELEGVGHMGVQPPADLLSELLDQKRAHYPDRVRQIFRLPDQSTAYWVSADAMSGEPLPDTQLNIPVAQGADPIVAQRKWIVDRLGLIEARCKEQTIKIRSHRVPRVVLLFSDELIDLDQPIRIFRGKRKCFQGRIERDMRVMLTEAARGWDFDRLPTARVVVPVGGKVKFGYPDADKERD